MSRWVVVVVVEILCKSHADGLEFGHCVLALESKISHEMVVFTPNVTLSSMAVIRTTVVDFQMPNCVIVCHGVIKKLGENNRKINVGYVLARAAKLEPSLVFI